MVGSWLLYTPGGGPNSVEWGARVEFLGQGVATCLISLVGLVGVRLLWRRAGADDSNGGDHIAVPADLEQT